MPVLRFHLLTIEHEITVDGFIVTVTTNAACHLYLRYSDVPPRIHPKSVDRRGLSMGWDVRFCFVSYQDLEQDEPGDTFTHTFTWPGWVVCTTHYFYFWGTMGGQAMVSDSPIFSLHYLWECPPPGTYVFTPGYSRGYLTGVDANYITAHDNSDALLLGYGFAATGFHCGQRHFPPSDKFHITRGLVTFPTSSLCPSSTIDSAKLSLRGTKYVVKDWNLVIVKGDFHHPTPLTSDYGELLDETEDFGSINNSLITNTVEFDIPLTPAGIAQISKTGNTKLALRLSVDILSQPPGADEWDYILFSNTPKYIKLTVVTI